MRQEAVRSSSTLNVSIVNLGISPQLRHPIPSYLTLYHQIYEANSHSQTQGFSRYKPFHHHHHSRSVAAARFNMPLCTIHLLSLHQTTPNPIPTFLSTLKSSKISPLVVSKVIRWIILPTHLSTEHLLAHNISWHIYLILPPTDPLPPALEKLVEHHWQITAGVPSRLTADFATKNRTLLHPDASSVPNLGVVGTVETTTSSQNLELSEGLENWIHGLSEKERTGAVSMFNLLSFHPNKRSSYLKYGAAFASSIGSRHGGNAKIVGNVVASPDSKATSTVVDASGDGWDEIALAHYPSILHFRSMLLSTDYQEVNHRHRVGSLRDTCILMTSEVAIEEMMGTANGEAKL